MVRAYAGGRRPAGAARGAGWGAGECEHAASLESAPFVRCSAAHVELRWCDLPVPVRSSGKPGNVRGISPGWHSKERLFMVVVGVPEPTYPKPRVDAVVATLSRLVVGSKAAYREPLLDALYQYRRREGIFEDRPKPPDHRRRQFRFSPQPTYNGTLPTGVRHQANDGAVITFKGTTTHPAAVINPRWGIDPEKITVV